MTFDENASAARPGQANSDELSPGLGPGSGRMGSRRVLTSGVVAVAVLAAIAALAGVGAVLGTVGEPVLAQPQPVASSFDPVFSHHLDLLGGLREWVEALPGIKASGYLALNDNLYAGSTILLWYGPPDRIQRQILDEARRRHISISVQRRTYSMAALQQASNQINAIDSGTGEFENFTISGASSFDINFDGVVVVGEYIHPPAEGIPTADAALTQALTAKTGVAVMIEHGEFVPV
jgi:hypothetical protein